MSAPSLATRTRPQILCVDDEPNVLEGLSMHLRRAGEVHTAQGGREALALLERMPEMAVVISDMRMPHMDGATFLARARALAPSTTRILLTGQSELEAAIAAVNDGQIFRFLTKPCPPSSLLAAVDAALEQHRLIHAERVLLEQTLHGSVKALTDVLALVDPLSFGRATRIKRLVSELCDELVLLERWPVEVAAMLSQLGNITLPAETVEKLQRGDALDAREAQMRARIPAVVEQLLGNIPRLEPVRALLMGLLREGRTVQSELRSPEARRTASVLRIAADYDTLEASGASPAAALAKLGSRAQPYEPEVLAALERLRGNSAPVGSALGRAVDMAALRVGMVFAEDVRSRTGILLAARGFEVTEGFIERVQNLRAGSVPNPLRVL